MRLRDEKVCEHHIFVCSKSSLIDSEDTPLHPMKSSSHFFALQRRSDIITAVNPATPAFLASSDTSQAVYLESPFRSVNLAILDNACSEYSFLTSYFSGSSFSSLSTRFAQIFGPTFALGQNFTSSLVGQSTDCLGILLCVRLNEQFALESQRRKIPVLEPYINENARLLWPRFQKAIDAHCDSLRHAASVSSLTTRNLSNTLSSLAGAASTPSLAPHFLTQRFAQFIHGILNLTKERVNKTSGLPIVVGDSPKSAGSHRSDVLLSPGLSSDEEPIGRSLLRLRSEFENVMNRLSKEIGDQRKIDRFLSNNYGLIGTILGDVPGVMADEMRAWLSERGGDREIS